HELPPAGNRPADAELEGKEELLEQPALLGKDQPRPDDHGSRRDAVGLALGRFPILYDLCDEARLAGLGFLIEDLGAAITVVADRRLPDEDIRPRGGRLHPLQEVARAYQPALPDPDLRLIGQPLIDLLADQVDDAIDVRESLCGRTLRRRLPWVPVDRRVLGTRPARIPGQPHDLVSPSQQGVAQRRAEQAGGSRDENAHWRRMLAGGGR